MSDTHIFIAMAILFIGGAVLGYIGKMFMDDLADTDLSKPHDDYD